MTEETKGVPSKVPAAVWAELARQENETFTQTANRHTEEAANNPVEVAPDADVIEEPPPLTMEQKVEDFRERHGFGTKFTRTEPEPGQETPQPVLQDPGVPTPPPTEADWEAPAIPEPAEPGAIQEIVEAGLGPAEGDGFGPTGFENAVIPDEPSPADDILQQRVQELEQQLQDSRISSMQQMQMMELRMTNMVQQAVSRAVGGEETPASSRDTEDTSYQLAFPKKPDPTYDPDNLMTEYTSTPGTFKVRGGTWTYDTGSAVSTIDLNTTSGEALNTVSVVAAGAGGIYAKLNLTGAALFTIVYSAANPTWAADIYYMKLAEVDSSLKLVNRRSGNIGPTVLSGGGVVTHDPYPFEVLDQAGGPSTIKVRGGHVMVTQPTGLQTKVDLDDELGGTIDSQTETTDDIDASVGTYAYLDLDLNSASPASWTLSVVLSSSLPPSTSNHFYKMLSKNNASIPFIDPADSEQRWFGGSFPVWYVKATATTPAQIGTQAVGTSAEFARANHVHKALWNFITDASANTALSPDTDGTLDLAVGGTNKWKDITVAAATLLAQLTGNISLLTSAGDIDLYAEDGDASLRADTTSGLAWVSGDILQLSCDTLRIAGPGATGGSTGWSGTFTNGDADTVTVTNGIITGVA